MVKEALASDKPVAAQLGSIRTLAKAGVLKDKKYAAIREFADPYFEGATRTRSRDCKGRKYYYLRDLSLYGKGKKDWGWNKRTCHCF